MTKQADLTPIIGVLSDPKYNQGAVNALTNIKRPKITVDISILAFDNIDIAPKDQELDIIALEKKYYEAFDTLAKEQLSTVNGLFLPGDEYDAPPELYGQKKHEQTDINPDPRRTLLVRALLRNSQEYNITPALAICGSLQQYTALNGGDLIQHVPDISDASIEHSQANNKYDANAHTITTRRFTDRTDSANRPVASTLYRILQSKEERIYDPDGKNPCLTWVNSIHHQAVDAQKRMDKVAVTSIAPDGIVEALEPIESLPFIALQWHPELIRRMDRNGQRNLTNDDYQKNLYGNGIDFDNEGHPLPKDLAYEANQRILEDLIDKSATHLAKHHMVENFEKGYTEVTNSWQKHVSNNENEKSQCIMV